MTKYGHGLLVALLALFLASAAQAYTGTYSVNTGVAGSPHDLAQTNHGMSAYNNPADATLDRICIFCHTPHNAYKLSSAQGGPDAGIGGGLTAGDDFDYLPLWNHELQSDTVYSMYFNGYGAPTTGAKASQAIQQNPQKPGGVSLLCLSCHDGTVAANSYGNPDQPVESQSAPTAYVGTGYIIGKDKYLGNHHPIGFDMKAAQLQDAGLINPTVATYGGTAGTVETHLYGAGNTMMECPTCHSVHNKDNAGERLLWKSDANSAFCLTCHDK